MSPSAPPRPPCGVPVPDAFSALLAGRPAEGGPDGDAWLASLPRLVAAALERWDLTTDGPARHGFCALVLPVRRRSEPLMLKVVWPHKEARHEHLALRAWAGRGAVRLTAAHPSDGVLLLERLDADARLGQRGVEEACAVLGALLARLDVPAFPRLDCLSDWTRGFLRRTADVRSVAATGVPRRFVEQARSLAQDLSDAGGVDGHLVHTDLHDGNVLGAPVGRPGAQEGWLAIDPRPMAAEPEFAVAPALWNRWGDALVTGDPHWHLKSRLAWICEAAGVDEDRARAWSLIRLVANAAWQADRGHQGVEGDSAPMTALVAAMKAMADSR